MGNRVALEKQKPYCLSPLIILRRYRKAGINMQEQWKDVVGYEGLYQVSNLGNVRSLNWGNTKTVRNMYLKNHNKGYKQVELVKESKKMFLVHRLVAEAFIENPNNYPFINHKDEVKSNNRVENLEWCTASYNAKYSAYKRTGARKPYKNNVASEQDTNKKILQISKDNTVVKEWENFIEALRANNWNEWSIAQCCRGKRHTAYGYYWQFAK